MRFPTLFGLSLRVRVAVAYAVFLLVIVGGIGFYLLASLGAGLQREADETLALRASHIQSQLAHEQAQAFTQAQAARVVEDLSPTDEFSAPGLYVQILDGQGVTVAASPNLPGASLPVDPSLLVSAREGGDSFADVPIGADRLRVLVRLLKSADGPAGYVIVAESMHLQDAAQRNTLQLLLFAAVGSALAALLGGWYLTGRALGPVMGLTRLARRIATTGKFDQRLDSPRSRDEIGELAATFNDMISRLDATFARQRDFLADASHELRGPLMVIRGNLDLLKLDLSSDDRLDSVREATEEVDRMAGLVGDLLFLSEADAQQTVDHKPVQLQEVVGSVFDRAKDLDAGSHRLSLVRNDPCSILGDRERLQQLLWNLIENALRYTPKDGKVDISLHRQGPVAEMKVTDSGIGIASEYLGHIFERFYRVDRARSRHQGGTGLGLAIVKQVADAHGAQVRVRSEPGEGTTFTVVFPISQ